MEKNYDHLFKIVLVGDSGVGKSSLLLRFADGAFTESFISTIGVDFRFRTVEVLDKIVKLQIWDTAGQERFRTITSAYYRGASGIFLVYDVTDPVRNHNISFDNTKEWLQEVRKHVDSDVELCLVGNKSDLSTKQLISQNMGQEMAESIQSRFIETSAKSAENVEQAFLQMATKLVENEHTKMMTKLGTKEDFDEDENVNTIRGTSLFGENGDCCK